MENTQVNDKLDEVTDAAMDTLLAEKKPASSGKGVAVLALLLALAAIGQSGWQWWQQRSAGSTEVSQQQSMQRLQAAQQELGSSLTVIEAQLKAAGTPVDPLEFSRLGEQFRLVKSQLESVRSLTGEQRASMAVLQGRVRSSEQRVSVLESSLTNIAARSQNSGIELSIAEIDFLLRTASERLQLFSDPVAAEVALQAADVQVEALNDPMFLSVRQRIAEARHALAAVPQVDRVRLSSRLTDMQTKIPGLPFHGEVSPMSEPEIPVDVGWWESLKHTLSSLVTVQRQVADDQALLSLEDMDYLRQGLWLQLESARLALMRNDGGAYAASLDRVSTSVDQFFQRGSEPVQALLLQLAELRQVNIAPVMPDISAPWTQLRQLRDSRRLLQSTTPVAGEDGGR